jgi:uncharacterized NAD(P)/FAD-binding protein YdhS
MIFGNIFTISRKGFLLNPKIHPAQTATRTRSFTSDQHRETYRQALGSRGPHPSARPSRDGADRRDLVDGEVSGQAKMTGVNPTVPAAWPRELEKLATAVHGGAVARVVTGETSLATAG